MPGYAQQSRISKPKQPSGLADQFNAANRATALTEAAGDDLRRSRMPEYKTVRFTPVDDDARKPVFGPHDIDGYYTLVEYQREDGGWRFVGETLVTDLLIRDGDEMVVADEAVV